MKVPRYQLAAVLGERSLTRLNPSSFSEEIAAYLLDEGRVDELDSLIRDIMQYRTEHGIVEVEAYTAHEITPAVRADIEKQVRSIHPNTQRVIVVPVHDDDVVGGVRLELANEQLDLSIRATLNRFKQLTAGKEN